MFKAIRSFFTEEGTTAFEEDKAAVKKSLKRRREAIERNDEALRCRWKREELREPPPNATKEEKRVFKRFRGQAWGLVQEFEQKIVALDRQRPAIDDKFIPFLVDAIQVRIGLRFAFNIFDPAVRTVPRRRPPVEESSDSSDEESQ